MGVYLNSKKPFSLFYDEAASSYFIDKSAMLKDLFPLVEESEEIIGCQNNNGRKSNKYMCITRPRRFGKTLMASMIAFFLAKGETARMFFKD